MEISLNKLFCPRARCSSFLWPSFGSVFRPTFSRFQLLGEPWAHLQNPINLLHQQRHPNEFNEIFGQRGFLLFSTVLNDYKCDRQITCNGELFLWRCQQAGRCLWQPGCAWSHPRTYTVSPCCTGSPEFTKKVMIRQLNRNSDQVPPCTWNRRGLEGSGPLLSSEGRQRAWLQCPDK